MCVNPVLLPNGQEVACHKCWQCIKRKVEDWTGRCIAESKTAFMTRSVTLTYGRDKHLDAVDHLRAAVLTYSDVQTYIRSMRDAGYIVRYFIVGEYGSKKGRSHWHGVLFFDGTKLPLRPLDRNFMDTHWPHGHSFWQQGSPETLQYVCKYITKDAEDDNRQFHCGLSKLPPLGDAWFKRLALQFVEQGLAPQDLLYSFPDIRDRKDHVRIFKMKEATARNFLQAYIDQWKAVYGNDRWPNSELVEKFLDDQALEGSQDAARALLAGEKVGIYGLRDSAPHDPFTGVAKRPMDSDLRAWMDPKRVKWSETLNVWLYEFEGSQGPWYWAKDPTGVWSWRAKIGAGHPVPSKSYHDAKRAG